LGQWIDGWVSGASSARIPSCEIDREREKSAFCERQQRRNPRHAGRIRAHSESGHDYPRGCARWHGEVCGRTSGGWGLRLQGGESPRPILDQCTTHTHTAGGVVYSLGAWFLIADLGLVQRRRLCELEWRY